MEYMTELEKSGYQGLWISLSVLSRDIEVGDLVMIETADDVLVVKIDKIDEEGVFWHYNRWIIPKDQIISVKLF